MIKNRTVALALAAVFAAGALPATEASARPKKISVMKDAVQPASPEALVMAAKEGDINEVRRHLALGIGTQADRNDALAGAAFAGRYEAAEILLQAGADPNAHSKRIIQMAARNGHTDVIELLLKHKASVRGNGNQPLAEAAGNNRLETIDYLLDNPIEKADINDNFGWALATAMVRGAVEGVKHLLTRGADPYAGSVQAIYLEIKKDPAKILKPEFYEIITAIDTYRAANPAAAEPVIQQPEFEKEEKTPPAPLTEAEISVNKLMDGVRDGNFDLVKEALEEGANPNARGGAPLYVATHKNYLPITILLLEKGANPDFRNGWILVEALENANVEAVMALLSHGANSLLPGVDEFLMNYEGIMKTETPETGPRHFSKEMTASVDLVRAHRAALQLKSQPAQPAPTLSR